MKMNRREYLKAVAAGSVGAGILLQSCDTESKKVETTAASTSFPIDRNKEELAYEQKVMAAGKYFNDHEMKTISILVDIIIPADEISGSATDAGVPDFIEFMAKDRPSFQLPLRGGLRWLDVQCLKRFNADFASCTPEQRIEIVEEIAYPERAKPEMQQGVAFFNLMRDLTATGFFTSEMGIKDLGYVGNRPNQWDGVPQDVLDQYGLKYDERTLEISVRFDS